MNQGNKIDKLMDLVNEVKSTIIALKYETMSKPECEVKHGNYEKKIADLKLETEQKIMVVMAGQKKLLWAAVTFTIALIMFLIQQLLNLQIRVGG